MFIELPPYSASPSDQSGTEALFDLHTVTVEVGTRADASGRVRLVLRGSRESGDRVGVTADDFLLTYTHGV